MSVADVRIAQRGSLGVILILNLLTPLILRSDCDRPVATKLELLPVKPFRRRRGPHSLPDLGDR